MTSNKNINHKEKCKYTDGLSSLLPENEKLDQPLYHYTSMDVFCNYIAKNKTVRMKNILSGARNDNYDVKHGLEILNEQIDSHVKVSKYTGTELVYAQIKEIIEMLVNDSLSTSNQGNFLNRIYMFCTSLTNSDIKMWNDFADKGKGVCIEFKKSFSENFQKNGDNKTPLPFASKVSYDEGVFQVLCGRLLGLMTFEIDAILKRIENYNCQQPNKVEMFKKIFGSLASKIIYPVVLCLDYKPSKFAYEQEYRFLNIFSATDLCSGQESGDFGYYDYQLNPDKDIEKVWISNLTTDAEEQRLKCLLGCFGWNNVAIQKIDILFVKKQ